MLIRSAPQVCLVILPSGLTLELCYDHLEPSTPRAANENGSAPTRSRTVSQSVWLLHQEVLLKAEVGLA
jgi:hypothetical protein